MITILNLAFPFFGLVLAIAILTMLGEIEPLWFNVAIMMAALPTAANAFVLASQYRAYVVGASNSILVTTIISAFTLPGLVYLIKSGAIAF